MMMANKQCVNCNPNCFDHTTDGCIEVTVKSDSLGIEANVDSLKSALNKIIDTIEALGGEVSSGTTTVESQDLVITQSSTPFVVKTSVPMSLTIRPQQSDTRVDYDLRDVVRSLGGETILAKVEAYGSVNGRNTRIFAGKGQYGGFNASPENFPVNLTLEATVIAPDGQKVMRYNRYLTNDSQSLSIYLDIQDSGFVAVNSQAEVNAMLDKKTNSLQTQITGIEKVSFGGNTGLNSILTDIQSQINSLQEQINAISNG